MAAISPARKAAFQILLEIKRGPAHSDDLLRGKHVNALSSADRNLTTALVLGILRWQIQLDAEIKKHLTKPGARMDAEVLIALRLGAFQLLHLDRIPARAAIDESVELTKQAGHRFASGMVNAVLRKVSVANGSKSAEDVSPEFATFQGHPQWMVERWVAAYGFEQARAICRHDQAQPETAMRIAASEAEAELAGSRLMTKPGELLAQARRLISGDVTATAAFREGRISIQDEGSQFVGEIAAFVGGRFGQGSRILDACAAPGGKTLILLERNPKARVVACEVSEYRFSQLQKRLANFADRVELRHADSATLEDAGRFDLVLADVPCSGTGTLGRNPEIRHRLQAEDFERQGQRQQAILAAALRATKPGGRVVYSTCSVEAEENDLVVTAVLAQHSHARQLSLSQTLEKMETAGILNHGAAERLKECLTPEGALRILPGQFGTDGFFIALLAAADPAR